MYTSFRCSCNYPSTCILIHNVFRCYIVRQSEVRTDKWTGGQISILHQKTQTLNKTIVFNLRVGREDRGISFVILICIRLTFRTFKIHVQNNVILTFTFKEWCRTTSALGISSWSQIMLSWTLKLNKTSVKLRIDQSPFQRYLY